MDIPKKQIRQPIVSGLFYPEDPEELRQKVGFLITGKDREGTAPFILCPHGSWSNCEGRMARLMGAAFHSISRFRPRLIVLLGPVHREKEHPALYLPESLWFESPLGLVPVARKLCRALEASEGPFECNDTPHREEHSLELCLPFIQKLFPECPILPILTGGLKRKDIRRGAAILEEGLKNQGMTLEDCLFVVSANLSGYKGREDAEQEAEHFLKLLDLPLQGSLIQEEAEGRISSCGTGALTLLSDLSRKMNFEGKAHILEHCKLEHREKNAIKGVHYAALCWEDKDSQEN